MQEERIIKLEQEVIFLKSLPVIAEAIAEVEAQRQKDQQEAAREQSKPAADEE